MKLNEVAKTKEVRCGLIMPAGGNESLDAGDWHGATMVFTNQTAFFKQIQLMFVDFLEHGDEGYDEDDEDDMSQKKIDGEQIAAIKAAKSLNDLYEMDDWDSFINGVWIDDRF